MHLGRSTGSASALCSLHPASRLVAKRFGHAKDTLGPPRRHLLHLITQAPPNSRTRLGAAGEFCCPRQVPSLIRWGGRLTAAEIQLRRGNHEGIRLALADGRLRRCQLHQHTIHLGHSTPCLNLPADVEQGANLQSPDSCQGTYEAGGVVTATVPEKQSRAARFPGHH